MSLQKRTDSVDRNVDFPELPEHINEQRLTDILKKNGINCLCTEVDTEYKADTDSNGSFIMLERYKESRKPTVQVQIEENKVGVELFSEVHRRLSEDGIKCYTNKVLNALVEFVTDSANYNAKD